MQSFLNLLAAYGEALGFTLAVYGVGLLLERARPVEPFNWRAVLFNLRTLLAFQAVATLLAVLAQPAVLHFLRDQLPALVGLIKLRDLGESTLLLIGYLCMYDFFYYWLHRAQHAYPWLWATHRLHHTETNLNVTSTLRLHWLEELFKLAVVILPMLVLFDGPPAAVGLFAGAIRFWLFFIHMNARISFGPLSWVMTSPAAHRIHHSIEHRDRDRNFAALFPVWDVVFGTYLRPRPGEWPRTGVEGIAETTLWNAMRAPFLQWFGKRAPADGSSQSSF